MPLSDAATARSRAYALFSSLYLDGVTPATLPIVRTLPALAEALEFPFDAKQAAAEHYDLFHLNVYPYASLFLDASGRLGGAVTDEARRLLDHTGYPLDVQREPADHLGHVLGALAFLTGAEADALEDDHPDEAARMQRLQCRIFDAYLSWWLPPFVQALRRHQPSFFVLLGDLTLDLVLDHRMTLGPAEALPHAPLSLPDPPALLNDDRTTLKDIATYLTTAAWSGLYLSRTEISRLSRAERLPRGFGSRVQMLTNLLHTAVDYDQVTPVLAHLVDLVQTWRTFFTTLETSETPCLAPRAAQWRSRLETTQRLVDTLCTALPPTDS